MNLFTMAIIALIFACWFASSRRNSAVAEMSNVHFAKQADEYLDKSSFELTHSDETFLYQKVVAVPRPQAKKPR